VTEKISHRIRRTEDEIIEFAGQCVHFLEDRKALDTILIDLKEVNSYLDYFLITTGNSRIHCRALARDLEKQAHSLGVKGLNRPDYDSEWIILDFSEIIVHIFTMEMREYYQLERLWGDARRITF
jgi:ribosome-associated protein